MSVTQGRNEPSNVRPAKIKIDAIQDKFDFEEIQRATVHEMRTNEVRLKRAEEREAKRWMKAKVQQAKKKKDKEDDVYS